MRIVGPYYSTPMENELFDICCGRNPNPSDQRRQIIMALKGGADIHATDKNGVTALHHAVRFRSPAAVKTLIEHGANMAVQSKGSSARLAGKSDADLLALKTDLQCRQR